MLLPPSLPPFNSNVLTIKSVASEHGGQYTCEVNNVVGNVTVMFNVDVKPNIIPYIIAIAAMVGLAVTGGLLLGVGLYYKRYRTGKYSMKDVFRLKAQHVAVPIIEKI
ncbi:vascular cell adhesion protein 1-like protein [Lates japonicus]|uniref:Vascular cell adhesion protein 1-like protein n=1 Tax=Lates japonicus TaxID=270547 RepID=A0AAD3MZJ5_LATJO|nr:vascular cell adhesion protein 1-like protein [Lates japonicus]